MAMYCTIDRSEIDMLMTFPLSLPVPVKTIVAILCIALTFHFTGWDILCL